MIRNRVAPIELPKVKEQHRVGVFGEFADVMDDAIARAEAAPGKAQRERALFFRHLRDKVDHDRFGRMQERFLSDGVLDPAADLVKYIDPTLWFESKLAIAQRLGLKGRGPSRILDVGTGPAHFPVVAAFYGHEVVGTDLPLRVTGDLEGGHLYDVLGDIYGVRRLPLKVRAFQPLPDLDGRYDLVTAFLAAFNVREDKSPWGPDEWAFFLRDVRDNVLVPGGEVYMSLANQKLSEEAWRFLADRAAFTLEQSKQIHLKDLSAF